MTYNDNLTCCTIICIEKRGNVNEKANLCYLHAGLHSPRCMLDCMGSYNRYLFFKLNSVFTFLGLVVLVVDTLTENMMGSIIAIICILMNITSYNLLGIDVYRWIPCALAQ